MLSKWKKIYRAQPGVFLKDGIDYLLLKGEYDILNIMHLEWFSYKGVEYDCVYRCIYKQIFPDLVIINATPRHRLMKLKLWKKYFNMNPNEIAKILIDILIEKAKQINEFRKLLLKTNVMELMQPGMEDTFFTMYNLYGKCLMRARWKLFEIYDE